MIAVHARIRGLESGSTGIPRGTAVAGRSAGHQEGHLGNVATVERQVLDPPLIDCLGELGGVCVGECLCC